MLLSQILKRGAIRLRVAGAVQQGSEINQIVLHQIADDVGEPVDEATAPTLTIGANGGGAGANQTANSGLSVTGGSIASGLVSNNGNLTINRSDVFTIGVANAISGTGSFTQAGGGVGNTIGAGATLTSSVTATLAANGTLAINGTLADSLTVASGATLSGSGGVNGTTGVTRGTINGTGLTLTGLTTFNGAGNILSGTVTSTNGVTLASSAALALNGALTGNLAVGDGTLTIRSGRSFRAEGQGGAPLDLRGKGGLLRRKR